MKLIAINFEAPPELVDRLNAHIDRIGMKKGRWLAKAVMDAIDREVQQTQKRKK